MEFEELKEDETFRSVVCDGVSGEQSRESR